MLSHDFCKSLFINTLHEFSLYYIIRILLFFYKQFSSTLITLTNTLSKIIILFFEAPKKHWDLLEVRTVPARRGGSMSDGQTVLVGWGGVGTVDLVVRWLWMGAIWRAERSVPVPGRCWCLPLYAVMPCWCLHCPYMGVLMVRACAVRLNPCHWCSTFDCH